MTSFPLVISPLFPLSFSINPLSYPLFSPQSFLLSPHFPLLLHPFPFPLHPSFILSPLFSHLFPYLYSYDTHSCYFPSFLITFSPQLFPLLLSFRPFHTFPLPFPLIVPLAHHLTPSQYPFSLISSLIFSLSLPSTISPHLHVLTTLPSLSLTSLTPSPAPPSTHTAAQGRETERQREREGNGGRGGARGVTSSRVRCYVTFDLLSAPRHMRVNLL